MSQTSQKEVTVCRQGRFAFQIVGIANRLAGLMQTWFAGINHEIYRTLVIYLYKSKEYAVILVRVIKRVMEMIARLILDNQCVSYYFTKHLSFNVKNHQGTYLQRRMNQYKRL
jgi:hypothetical protein